MTPEASVGDGRIRGDETVRRLREESRQRVERERRWRGFTSWCALASLVSGGGLVVLNAYDARERLPADLIAVAQAGQPERTEAAEAAAMVKERAVRIAEACARRAAALEALDTAASEAVLRARSSEERANIRLEEAGHVIAVLDDAAAAGCDGPVPLPLRDHF